MNIFVDPEAVTISTTGIKVYARKLISSLAHMHPEDSFFSRSKTINPLIFHNFSKRVMKETGVDIKFSYRLFPTILNHKKVFIKNKISDQFDVMHLMTNKVPWGCPFVDPQKLVLTIHDVFYFHTQYHVVGRNIMQNAQRKAAQAAKAIITVSEFSKKEIVKFLNVDAGKVFVTPIAIQWDRDLCNKYPDQESKGNFFLAVGAIKENKNYPTLLRAFQYYRRKNKKEKLVIVGCCQNYAILRKIVNTEGVLYFPEISSEKLIQFYKTAKGFFALSTLEGFGIPLLEAMTCGCPSCYAKGNSMDEIGREAAFSIEDSQDWKTTAEIMQEFSSESSKVNSSVNACKKIASEYSWERCAELTYSIYSHVKRGEL